MKHILTLLFLISLVLPLTAQQLPVNATSVDVGSLSDAQIQRIISEMQTRGLTQEQAIALARGNARVAPHLEGRNIKRVVFVPSKILNLVVE